jgi:hypothetical protein
MAHFTRVRTFGGWAALTTLDDTEMEKFDSQGVAAINGDGGGSWAPSAEITITGTSGFRSFSLKGGANISGNPAFETNPTTGEITLRGLSTFSGASVHNNTVAFNGTTNFTAPSTFDDDGIFNSDAIFNSTVTIPSAPGGAVVASASAQPYFEVSPTVAFTDTHIHWRSLTSDSTNPSVWKEDVSILSGGQVLIAGTPGADGMVKLDLDPNCTYTAIKVVVKGQTHTTFPPAARTRFVLQEVDTVARTTTAISNTENDNAAQVTYEGTHTLALTGITPFRPAAGKQYYIYCRNESGTNSVSGYFLFAVIGSGTISRFGTHINNPILTMALQEHKLTPAPEKGTYAGVSAQLTFQGQRQDVTNEKIDRLAEAVALGFKNVDAEFRRTRSMLKLSAAVGYGIVFGVAAYFGITLPRLF